MCTNICYINIIALTEMAFFDDEDYDRHFRNFSPLIEGSQCSVSSFFIEDGAFDNSSDEEVQVKKRMKQISTPPRVPSKKETGTSMHGTLTPEQAYLIEINRKRAVQLQNNLRMVYHMEETLKELKEEVERLRKPVSECLDLTVDAEEDIIHK